MAYKIIIESNIKILLSGIEEIFKIFFACYLMYEGRIFASFGAFERSIELDFSILFRSLLEFALKEWN